MHAPRSAVTHRLIAGSILFLTASANADFFVHAWEDQHQAENILGMDFNLGYYTTQENFDENGSFLAPSGLQSYKRLQTDATFSYGLNRKLTPFARLSWANVQLDHASRGGSGYGLTDQTIGASYRILEKGAILDLQIQADIPLYDNASADASLTPYLGDGSTDLTFGAFFYSTVLRNGTDSINISCGAGYTARSAGFSAALPWSAVVRYLPQEKGLMAGLGVAGIQSLRTDPTVVLAGSTSTSQGTGGSFITNAVNPTLLSVQGEVGMAVNRDLAFRLFAGRSILGTSAPHGMKIGLGLVARLGGNTGPNGTSDLPKLKSTSNRGFLTYTTEARVLRANDRLNLLKIDKGKQDGVEVGQVFDIFSTTRDGTASEAIARARVMSVKIDEAALSILEYFREVLIDEGFIAKRLNE